MTDLSALRRRNRSLPQLRPAWETTPEAMQMLPTPRRALNDPNTLPYYQPPTRQMQERDAELYRFSRMHEANRNPVNTPPGTYPGQDVMEFTGLPSIARGVGHLRDGEPGAALPEIALGGLGVMGMVGGGGARTPRARWPMEAPPRLPEIPVDASPRPPTRIYRGLKDEHDPTRAAMLGDRWWHTNPDVASTYAPGENGAHVVPGVLDESSLNLARIEAEPGTNSRHIPVEALPVNIRRALPRGATYANTHEVAAAAEAAGYDGVTFAGIRDSGYGNAMEGPYPGFQTGDDGRVVAIFNDQAVQSPFPRTALPRNAERTASWSEVPPATWRDLDTWGPHGDVGDQMREMPIRIQRTPLRDIGDTWAESPESVQQYANLDTPFPPVLIRRNADGSIRLLDGNHRVGAAGVRGDSTIETIDLGQFDNLRQGQALPRNAEAAAMRPQEAQGGRLPEDNGDVMELHRARTARDAGPVQGENAPTWRGPPAPGPEAVTRVYGPRGISFNFGISPEADGASVSFSRTGTSSMRPVGDLRPEEARQVFRQMEEALRADVAQHQRNAYVIAGGNNRLQQIYERWFDQTTPPPGYVAERTQRGLTWRREDFGAPPPSARGPTFYHASPTPLRGELRASEMGELGPGVYVARETADQRRALQSMGATDPTITRIAPQGPMLPIPRARWEAEFDAALGGRTDDASILAAHQQVQNRIKNEGYAGFYISDAAPGSALDQGVIFEGRNANPMRNAPDGGPVQAGRRSPNGETANGTDNFNSARARSGDLDRAQSLPGGALRELDDSGARVTFPAWPAPTRNYQLGELLDHPELYDIYPELRNFPVVVGDARLQGGRYGTAGFAEADRLLIDPSRTREFTGDKRLPSLRALIAHELQHVLDRLEGRAAQGGSPDWLRQNVILPDGVTPQQAYERLGTEQTAFATERRIGLNAEQRAASEPFSEAPIGYRKVPLFRSFLNAMRRGEQRQLEAYELARPNLIRTGPNAGPPRTPPRPRPGQLSYEDLPPERYREMARAHFVGYEDVPINRLTRTQERIDPAFDPEEAALTYDENMASDLPEVYRAADGKLYLLDGHHRVLGLAHRGDQTVRVRMLGRTAPDRPPPRPPPPRRPTQ